MIRYCPWRSRASAFALMLLLAGCAGPTTTFRLAPVVESEQGVVTSADPLATAAGLEMLRRGGNAADAAAAAGFALAVVEPTMSGIGGRVVALVREPDGAVSGIDGMTEVPRGYEAARAQGLEYGYPTIGIPGAVAAYARLLEQHGTLSLATVLEPAIRLAEQGYEIRFDTADARLDEFAGARAIFRRPDGSPYRVADRLRQPELARTLRAIAAGGKEAFYRGDVARAMAADMARHGGFVTEADLAQYDARPLRIVRGRYRGLEVVATGSPPSGYMIVAALHALDQFDLASAAPSTWASLLCEALLLAREARDAPDQSQLEREREMLSPAWAANQARRLRERRLPDISDEHTAPVDNTSHLSVVDRDGRIVLVTQSLGPPFGARVVTPGLGFLYAVTMGDYKDGTPGTRPNLSTSPMLVERDGRAWLGLGAAGGGRIPSALLSVLSRMLDQGDDLATAIARPRVHAGARCPQLENSGTLTLTATVSGDRLRGTIESDVGARFPVEGLRESTPDTATRQFVLSFPGATSHPYVDVGAFDVLTWSGERGDLQAKLRARTDGPHEPRAWSSTRGRATADTVEFVFPARFGWSDADLDALRQAGADPSRDQAVARVHALAFDENRRRWIGVADPRGHGSAGTVVDGGSMQ